MRSVDHDAPQGRDRLSLIGNKLPGGRDGAFDSAEPVRVSPLRPRPDQAEPPGPKVRRWGTAGPRVIFVPGARPPAVTWASQRPLACRMRVEMVVRQGWGDGAIFAGDADYLRDADDLTTLLDTPAHLVGAGYGAVSCALAAAERPHRVESLTLIEPTSVRLLRSRTVSVICRHRRARDRGCECRAHEASESALETIAQWGIPTQVYSSGDSKVLTAMSEMVAIEVGGEHVRLIGSARPVQSQGAPFNERLRKHIEAAAL